MTEFSHSVLQNLLNRFDIHFGIHQYRSREQISGVAFEVYYEIVWQICVRLNLITSAIKVNVIIIRTANDLCLYVIFNVILKLIDLISVPLFSNLI
jgi:hypothetical protein